MLFQAFLLRLVLIEVRLGCLHKFEEQPTIEKVSFLKQ